MGANVALKQGEHPGKKDVNRMREAIINKKSDESKWYEYKNQICQFYYHII